MVIVASTLRRVNYKNSLGSSSLEASIICSAAAPGGQSVAFGALNGQVGLFDMQTGNYRLLNDPRGTALDGVAVERIVFSMDGSKLAWVDQGGNAELWTARDPHRIKAWRHAGMASAIAFSPTGRLVASGASDLTVIVQDTTSGDGGSFRLGEHAAFVNDLAFSPDN